jgi:hypothetical protein
MKELISCRKPQERYWILLLLLATTTWMQLQAQPKEYSRFGLYGGVGYHGNVNRQISGSFVTDNSVYDYFPLRQALSNVYFDIGGVYQWKNMEAGTALRITFPSTLLENGFSSETYPIMPMANFWVARYFGKADQRAYSAGFNITPVVYRNFYPSVTAPPPNNRVADFGPTTTYWAFGPTIGTRILRKGWFKQTYLQLNPQVAPPPAVDRARYKDLGWYWRVNIGLTKNFNFKKK